MFEPGGPKEQVRAGGKEGQEFGEQVEKQTCCGDLGGGVKCSVPGGALGFLEAETGRTPCMSTSQRGAGGSSCCGDGLRQRPRMERRRSLPGKLESLRPGVSELSPDTGWAEPLPPGTLF